LQLLSLVPTGVGVDGENEDIGGSAGRRHRALFSSSSFAKISTNIFSIVVFTQIPARWWLLLDHNSSEYERRCWYSYSRIDKQSNKLIF
jgi:hypothetical protein